MKYSFRPAESEDDFAQIRRLNHRIFAEELRQHPTRPGGLLPDPYEARSRFILAFHSGQLVGMVCTHSDPPYSVEKRLPNPAVLQALPPPLCEVRLLSLAPEHRNKLALLGLLGHMFEDALLHGYRTLIISGITSRQKMYRELGFVELGPAVPEGSAAFYPMALDLHHLPPEVLAGWRRYQRRTS